MFLLPGDPMFTMQRLLVDVGDAPALKNWKGIQADPKTRIRRFGVAACQRLARCETLRDALSAMLTRAKRRSVDPPVMAFGGGKALASSPGWYWPWAPGANLGVGRVRKVVSRPTTNRQES
ncbi:hypothetical protein HPB47_001385 [Ixodes persulcatus]|uniref:Uncharacterized protein n=1 Tax=Ixodes persulcatus TaxID=34615 RepID=A0AC60PPJ0_IXOPE|nr:hypothetical protein HPB47_001385 [Ixodes persulcatus]